MKRNIKKMETSAPVLPCKKRVAAYARVSSGKEAMLHSLSAQVSYYSDLIQKHPGWEYVGVYSDEALTGTKENRPEFQRLLADCRAGRVDMVITKSISRLARNTVTMLETVRELKALGVDVWFEKENIHSLSGDGELMLTILASFAQEESRSVSENCKWRVRHQFQDGRPGSTSILGYKLIDGTLEILPQEAEVVKMIFNDFLSGKGRNAIMKKLNAMGVKTKRGNAWGEMTIYNILRNEIYIGDIILQKTFSSDHIEKKKCFNHGELPMYYVRDSHEPIIDRDTFERVQEELIFRAARHSPTAATQATYPFSGKIVCGVCGKHYRRKIGNGGSKYARAVWICSTFNRFGKAACGSKQIPEDTLLALSAEVLGLDGFDEAVFKKQIAEMRALEANKVVFMFRDGHEAEASWKDKSRRDSWTDEKRQQARDKALQRRCSQ